MTTISKIPTTKPSLSGTPTLYVLAQVRQLDDKRLRVQVPLPSIGVLESDVHVSTTLASWVGSVEQPYTSLAGTETKYAPCQVRCEEEGSHMVRVQVPGGELNRPWGAVFIVDYHQLAIGVAQAMKIASGETPEEKV